MSAPSIIFTTMARTKKEEKKDVPKAETPGQAFDLLGRTNSWADAMKKGMQKAYTRAKKSLIAFCQKDVVSDFLPARSLYFQWAIDNLGIEKKSFFEIMGPDSTGKSSLLYWFLGGWLPLGVPGAILSGEDKFIRADWARRCLHGDGELAERMLDHILVLRARAIDELWFQALHLVKNARDPASDTYVPAHIPIAIAVDLINKPVTREEAGKDIDYASTGGSKKKSGEEGDKGTALGEKGHTWDRAKQYHDLIRRFNGIMADNNLVVLITSHQNDDAAGTVKTSPFTAVWQKGTAHRTKPGGQAVNQSVALQVILAKKGWIYCDGKPIARRILGKPYKNSYGTSRRTFCFAIMEPPFADRDGRLEQGIRWDLTTVEWFAEEGILGFKRLASSPATAPLYSSSALKLTGVNILEAAAALEALPASKWEEIGRDLGISGYRDHVGEAIDQLKGS